MHARIAPTTEVAMRLLLAAAALLGSVLPCSATPISYNSAQIVYCLGSFDVGPCTFVGGSTGASITRTGTVNTSGETVTFTASSVSLPGTLGGKVSLSSNTFNSSGPGVMV